MKLFSVMLNICARVVTFILLFIAILRKFFTPDGKIDALHRKLKPTGAERLVWGDADRHYFPVTQSPYGPIGNLICWESYMPLARTALYQKGVAIYISCNTK